MTDAHRPGFETDVFPAELEEIRRRRAQLGLQQPDADGGPDVDKALIGLALSGGGIRCASLSLGILQVLSEKGILPRVDYLSTVSGGGLIGSAVSSVLNSPGTSTVREQFPLGFDVGKPDRPAVRYLRNQDRYLAPHGVLDSVRLPATVIRGLIDNVALLIPVLVAAVLFTEAAFAGAYSLGIERFRMAPALVVGLFVVLSLLQPVLYRLWARKATWKRRNWFGRLIALSLIGAIVALLCVPLFFVVQYALDTSLRTFKGYINEHVLWVWVVIAAFGLFIIAGTVHPSANRIPSKVVRRVALLALGAGSYAAVFLLYLLLMMNMVESPVLPPSIEADLRSGQVTDHVRSVLGEKRVEVDLEADVVTSDDRGGVRWTIDGPGKIIIVKSDGALRLVNVLFWDGARDWIFLGIGLFGLVYAVWLTNPNLTSQHAFFRDRLSHAFVFSVADGRVEPADDLRLSALNGDGTAAPYHLLNATLNLQGAQDSELAGRDADIFFFSKHWTGSTTTGYCQTPVLEQYDRQLTLATAMAVSGAGLSPNMGTETVRSLVFLFTLLNLRLDYWLPNPAAVHRAASSRFSFLRPLGPTALVKEAFGWIDARGDYVNVSDGGHVENLAVYELLRRRCKWIIVVDGSEDPTMTFDCLVALVRYARIDFGIEINMSLDPLRPDAEGLTKQHWAVGKIDYGSGDTGRFIYIKSSITGDEPETIRAYRRQSPSFPQEPSANQFFTEVQFEAYRALGEHMARAFLDSESEIAVALEDDCPYLDNRS